MDLHGDLSRRVLVRTGELEWHRSPGGEVLRKRLHRVGSAERGQVTSLVRFEPGAAFPAHDHPEGEEIFVLDGVFSDERGDFAAGSCLLSPEGFAHAPRSEEGCTLFVKLRQYEGADRPEIAIQVADVEWRESSSAGVEVKSIDETAAESTRLERWRPGAHKVQVLPGGIEIFVVEGSLEEGGDLLVRHSWLRLPEGATLAAVSRDGCIIYTKRGGVARLRHGEPAVS